MAPGPSKATPGPLAHFTGGERNLRAAPLFSPLLTRSETMNRTRLLPILLAALFGVLAVPAGALAAPGQATIMEDTSRIVNGDEATRAAALEEFRALGVDTVKMSVFWRDVAPAGASEQRPRFDAADPAAYPPGAWARYDAAIRAATERGFTVLLAPNSPAPEWATGRGERSGVRGAWKVDPAEYGLFVEAVGRRYSGTYEGLPRVSSFTLWNEPNHPLFMQPLSERLGGGPIAPSSPHRYRRMYVAGRNSLERTGHGGDTILFGEILPIGSSQLGVTQTIRPVAFLREFFCLDSRYRPYRGRAARIRDCSRFPAIRTSGFAYHAYTRPAGPRVAIPNRDDATIGQISRIERALDRIGRVRRPARGLPIFNTEFGLQSNPPDCGGFGTSLENQAAFINEAEYISYRRPRLRSYSNYLLVDSPILTQFGRGSNARYRGFQSGLRFGRNALACTGTGVFPEGSEKPAYAAFRTPIFVRRTSSNGVQVFGRARPRGAEPQVIEILRSGQVVGRVTATGYFQVPISGSTSGPWQLRWSFGDETFLSRQARALSDPPTSGRGPSRGPDRSAIGR